MQRSNVWLAPLTGVVFAALLVVAFIVIGEGQDATEETADELVAYYADHEDEQFIGGILVGLAGIFFLFFAGWVRRILRVGEEHGVLSAVAFAGAIVFVSGAAVGASLHITLGDLSDDISPTAVETINAIDWTFFIPFAVGMSTFLLASGLSALRHATLPRWLAWSAIVLGIATYTPAGFFAFVGALVWIVITSILLAIQARAAGAPVAP
jgi:hypothetical protein